MENKERKEPRWKARALRPGELMIGDLVWSEITERYARVAQLGAWGGIGTENGKFEVPNDKVSGVRITGEILKAMGLKQNKVVEHQYFTELPVEMNVEGEDGESWLVNVFEHGSGQVLDGVIVRYVHELQHVVRMMGVELGVAGEPRHAAGELYEVLNQN